MQCMCLAVQAPLAFKHKQLCMLVLGAVFAAYGLSPFDRVQGAIQ